jgi:nitrous oxide reductase accessory protein NosL
MGPDLIPHKDKEAAEAFMKEHKGKEIVSFDKVDMNLIKGLMK